MPHRFFTENRQQMAALYIQLKGYFRPSTNEVSISGSRQPDAASFRQAMSSAVNVAEKGAAKKPSAPKSAPRKKIGPPCGARQRAKADEERFEKEHVPSFDTAMNVVLEAMGKRFDAVDKRFIEIEKRDTVTAKKLDSLRDLVETKFKSLDAKLTTLDTANQTMHTTTHETQAAISDGLVNSVKVSNNAFERQLETLDDIARLVEKSTVLLRHKPSYRSRPHRREYESSRPSSDDDSDYARSGLNHDTSAIAAQIALRLSGQNVNPLKKKKNYF